jgi:hypothetical protein
LNAQSPQADGTQQDKEIAFIRVEFEVNGALKSELINSIRDEHLRVKAISAYEYALPIVVVEQW